MEVACILYVYMICALNAQMGTCVLYVYGVRWNAQMGTCVLCMHDVMCCLCPDGLYALCIYCVCPKNIVCMLLNISDVYYV